MDFILISNIEIGFSIDIINKKFKKKIFIK